ncbi:MAG: 3'-5' exonuclease [Chitinophagaceae bacterium]|nr:3'-5' exonuclease [Chitinophagaceae bacterium]
MTSTPPLSPLPRFFLDFETTGLSPVTTHVVEVALRGAASLDCLVSDAPPSTPEALRVHGITTWLCQREGRPSREVLADLIHALGPGPVEVVAHNAAFEQGFLEAWASREGVDLPEILWTCTLAWSRRLMPRAPLNHQLGSLAKSLGWKVEGLHRAAADTDLTVRLAETLEAWEQVQNTLGPVPGVVYLAGPLRGDGSSMTIARNQAAMATLSRWVQAMLPSATLLVPHLNFAFVDESGERGLSVRPQILRSCERLVARCDALILFGEPTEGMQKERQVAEFMKVPVLTVPGWDDLGAESELAPAAAQAG